MFPFLLFAPGMTPDPFGVTQAARRATAQMTAAMAPALAPLTAVNPLAAAMVEAWQGALAATLGQEAADTTQKAETDAFSFGVPGAEMFTNPMAAFKAMTGGAMPMAMPIPFLPMASPAMAEALNQALRAADDAARAVAEAVATGRGGTVSLSVTDPQSPVSVYLGVRVAPRPDKGTAPEALKHAGTGPILDMEAMATDSAPQAGADQRQDPIKEGGEG